MEAINDLADSYHPTGLTRLAVALLSLDMLLLPVQVRAVDMSRAMELCPGAAEFLKQQAASEEAKAIASAGRVPAVPTLPDLRSQILTMEKDDQQTRNRLIETHDVIIEAQMQEIDARHLPVLKKIFAEYGFPGTHEISQDGVDALWLLVQHADGDPTFQQQMLDAMLPRVKSGEVSTSKLALLTDRLLVAQDKPQRYGSQLSSPDGKHLLDQIEDPDRIEARRRELGLMPLADYRCMSEALYAPPTPKGG